MVENVEGEVIVVTGASSGLGEATGRLLARHGARLVLGARREERIQATAKELRDDGLSAIAVATDVSRQEDVQRIIDSAIRAYGRVDVIVNNAGVMPLSLLEKTEVAERDRMIDINLKGVLYGIASVLPHMISQKSRHVINVASTAGHRVSPSSAAYSATKYAVRALSEGLRQEATPHNIRCTIISPGASATELRGSITDADVAQKLKTEGGASSSPATFANLVSFAVSQPEDVDINEILFRPTAQQV